MRMWNISPNEMCRAHLLGEHVEMHMFAGCLAKNKNLNGYVKKGLIETHNIENRHNKLVKEMKRRGYNHNSPLPIRNIKGRAGIIDVNKNKEELSRRCKKCRKLMNLKL